LSLFAWSSGSEEVGVIVTQVCPEDRIVGDVRVGLCRRLRVRRGEIEEAILVRVGGGGFERAGSEDPEYVEGLRAAAAAALDYVLSGVERGGGSLVPVPVAVLEQAQRAARAGVGLDTVIRRYVAGYALLEDFVMVEAERGVLRGRERVLREVLQALGVLVQRLTAAAGSAYRQTEAEGRSAAVAERANRGLPGATPGLRMGMGMGMVTPVGAQRARGRIVRAIVEVVAVEGWAGASVETVVERARVSRRTLYEVFPGGLREGLVAALDDTAQQVIELAMRELEREECWRDGVRGALAALLVFFDSDPVLARVCFVETLGGDPEVVERRARAVSAFRELVVERIEREHGPVPNLAAESAIALVMGILYNRLLEREHGIRPEHDVRPGTERDVRLEGERRSECGSGPLIGLLGPLMGIVMTPLAAGEEAIATEVRRGEELARAIRTGTLPDRADGELAPSASNPYSVVRAHTGLTVRRLRECLLYLAGHPDASNSEIAEAVGVAHKSQISKLLAQLLEEGVAAKRRGRAGEPNAWRLTVRGEEFTRALDGG
jgi:AcrR family transcriptional regulator